ncbi:MAG: DUF3575 domain-containing protein [Muribaculaceae bacterium]|nr:DUF3575 domain-containing protein [Muribaculaceae bacterium]
MKLIAIALALMTVFTCFGRVNESDSVKVYFRAGHSQYDPAFKDNRQAMDSFMETLLKAYSDNNIESIAVRAYTSPDGTSKTNQRLAELRCETISDYISSNIGVPKSSIREVPVGIDWEGLRDLVAETPGVPSRNAILDILDNTPVWTFDRKGKIIDGRKNRLMKLAGGSPYRWMLTNLFPQLRKGVVISVIMKDNSNESDPDDLLKLDENTKPDEKNELNENITQDAPSGDSDLLQSSETSEPPHTSILIETPCQSSGNFAIKTNLLYYLALMPNIQFEWMFHEKWSVALETGWAWYAKNTSHKVYRLGTVSPEVRYWPISHSNFHGLYVGLFGGIGIYDLSNGKKGYEGEGGMTGVSCGYSWPIGKHLALDAGIGVGYMYTKYKEYRPLDGHFLYVQTKKLNYFGPLSLRLSLSWIIPNCKQSSKVKSVK